MSKEEEKKFDNEDTSKPVRCSKISVLKSMCYFKFIKKKNISMFQTDTCHSI